MVKESLLKYDLPIKIQEIADKLSLNRSYLYKIFKDYTGYSIKDYILHVKLEKSKELLQDLLVTCQGQVPFLMGCP